MLILIIHLIEIFAVAKRNPNIDTKIKELEREKMFSGSFTVENGKSYRVMISDKDNILSEKNTFSVLYLFTTAKKSPPKIYHKSSGCSIVLSLIISSLTASFALNPSNKILLTPSIIGIFTSYFLASPTAALVQ